MHGIEIDAYPAIKRHLETYRSGLEPRPRDWDPKIQGEWPGRKPGPYRWFEIQDNVAYWELFEQPKLLYQVIQFHCQYCVDSTGLIGNDKTYFIPSTDPFLVATLNSPVGWSFATKFFGHMKDEALNPAVFKMPDFPIPTPSHAQRGETAELVPRLVEITKLEQGGTREIVDWLSADLGIDKPGEALSDFSALDERAFAAEVKKRLPKKAGGLSPQQVKRLGEVYREYAIPIQNRRAEADKLEARLADLVNQAYGLTPEEIDLMWRTAPPRMPGKRPV